MFYKINFRQLINNYETGDVIDYDVTQAGLFWQWTIRFMPDNFWDKPKAWEYIAILDKVSPLNDDLRIKSSWRVLGDAHFMIISLYDDSDKGSLRRFPWTARIRVQRFNDDILTFTLRHRGYMPTPYIDIQDIFPL